MKIAIIDCVNQDIGLKILFPDADYYIHNDEDCTKNYRINSYTHYNIQVKYDWSNINDINYDYLFAIIPIYDAIPGKSFFKLNIYNIFNKIIQIINNNDFKKVFIFDNYDYDYDPSEYLINEKVNVFFKRNYSKHKVYNKKVIPFPFIMFGEVSLIEKCDRDFVENPISYCKPKYNRIFFSGGLYKHEDIQYNIIRDRITIYNKIQKSIYNPGTLAYNHFIHELQQSMFGLDLLGVGEPNKRTFEILLSGALLISQKHDMVWPFDDLFCEETYFVDDTDFFHKTSALQRDIHLYMKCLIQQYSIVKKYFNKEWLRSYILDHLSTKVDTYTPSFHP
jgi:hypothetical protein